MITQARKQRRLGERPWRALTGERIKAARVALDLTQEQFAILVGREEGRGIAPFPQHISRWELGERKPGALWGLSLLRIVEREERKNAQK